MHKYSHMCIHLNPHVCANREYEYMCIQTQMYMYVYLYAYLQTYMQTVGIHILPELLGIRVGFVLAWRVQGLGICSDVQHAYIDMHIYTYSCIYVYTLVYVQMHTSVHVHTYVVALCFRGCFL